MRRFKTLGLILTLAVIGAVGVGCPITNPPGPVITVNPGEVNFGTAGVTTEVDLYNTGTGTLMWSVDEDIPWLTVTPAAGTTTTEIDQLTLTVDRTGLTADTDRGLPDCPCIHDHRRRHGSCDGRGSGLSHHDQHSVRH